MHHVIKLKNYCDFNIDQNNRDYLSSDKRSETIQAKHDAKRG